MQDPILMHNIDTHIHGYCVHLVNTSPVTLFLTGGGRRRNFVFNDTVCMILQRTCAISSESVTEFVYHDTTEDLFNLLEV
jgi:hypothetical protein